MRVFGAPRRRGAWIVGLFLLAYALLVGARPPVLRSAVMACAVCGGMILRRPVLPANTFALAWLIVALLNPADLFDVGCQLSFLTVALLYWGTNRWFRKDVDPLEVLIEKSRPPWQRYLYAAGRKIALSYAVTLVIWLAVAPLVASRCHVISPIGALIGPPLVFLTGVALLFGFLLLLLAPLLAPLGWIFSGLVYGLLAAGDWIVRRAEACPGGYWYVGGVPEWWLWCFYLAFLAFVILGSLHRYWRWALLGATAWLCVGFIAGMARPASDELRCTFLAVGHGGCTVLETPDGRVLLYDAGAMAGPEVTRRHIAPFLWHRGIRRIDEVFLSHADLDHFNGLASLLDRFAIGQVTCTPTFTAKPAAGVRRTLAALQQRGISLRVVHAGDRLAAADVSLEVLHPPAEGPEGNENARSMVLLVRHAGHAILLTGDLEGPGLERVLSLPPMPVEILMAPHHGSRAANTPEFAAWAQPRLVISSQGPPRHPARAADPYRAAGAQLLETWEHGAVSVRSQRSGLIVETFLTGQRLLIRSEKGR